MASQWEYERAVLSALTDIGAQLKRIADHFAANETPIGTADLGETACPYCTCIGFHTRDCVIKKNVPL